MMNTGTLQVTLRGDREIVMARDFDAPRRLVFDAFTKPDLLKRWFGPPEWSLVVCEIDLQVGGAYRYVTRGPDGAELGMRGVYREIVPPERLVLTQSFEDPWSSGESLVTTVLVERGGKTTMTTTVRYESPEARDGAMKANMARGAAVSYDKLAALVERLASEPAQADSACP